MGLEKCFSHLTSTVINVYDPQWSSGWKKPKMGKHSGLMGRNSPKWALGRLFFVSAQSRDFFFSHHTLLPEGGPTAKW
jgi:hypothetical protein